MPRKNRRSAGTVDLPKGVHRVISRAREYFYWQPGRGTKNPGPRIRLPDDPQSPEFWVALRDAQGAVGIPVARTVRTVVDAYLAGKHFGKLGAGTKDQYQRALNHVCRIIGDEDPASVAPKHITALMDELEDTPGKANTILGALRALNSWALGKGEFDRSITEGVKPYPKDGGHKPWTDAQIAAATAHLTGAVRRGIFLGLYTGQRGSDIVRLGPTDIDEGGFRLSQQKTGREIWCPIVPELDAEMVTWEKRPGPYVLRDDGKPYSRKLFSLHFRAATESIPELAEATIHGLRSTAVVRLRRAGLSTGQISDIVGMSMAMIERYCRFADKKISGKAAVVRLAEFSARNKNRT